MAGFKHQLFIVEFIRPNFRLNLQKLRKNTGGAGGFFSLFRSAGNRSFAKFNCANQPTRTVVGCDIFRRLFAHFDLRGGFRRARCCLCVVHHGANYRANPREHQEKNFHFSRRFFFTSPRSLYLCGSANFAHTQNISKKHLRDSQTG